MAEGASLRVIGYRDFLRAADRAGPETKREVRGVFRQVGERVRVEATARFAQVDPRSAAGYRVVVRQRGVSVEQRLRKTTGLHPEFGTLQMRQALVPALEHHEARTQFAMEAALDRVADHFERKP